VTAPALPCVCLGLEEECGCDDEERLAKNLMVCANGLPPLDASTRKRWAAAAARVEGYPPFASNLELDDRDLARLWVESMVDFCYDKGLLR
jgi:hypothetical protein